MCISQVLLLMTAIMGRRLAGWTDGWTPLDGREPAAPRGKLALDVPRAAQQSSDLLWFSGRPPHPIIDLALGTRDTASSQPVQLRSGQPAQLR